jgi:hypothetical protein
MVEIKSELEANTLDPSRIVANRGHAGYVGLRAALNELEIYEHSDRVREARSAQRLAADIRLSDIEGRSMLGDATLLTQLYDFYNKRLDPVMEVYASYADQLRSRKEVLFQAEEWYRNTRGAVDVTVKIELTCETTPTDLVIHDRVMREIADRTSIPVQHTIVGTPDQPEPVQWTFVPGNA